MGGADAKTEQVASPIESIIAYDDSNEMKKKKKF